MFLVFLKLGVTSFGGPIAHLGYFREELIAKRRWLREGQYAELIALCQFLPGPASSQVGFSLGLARAGYRGAIAAWLAFTLPSAVLMTAFAFGATLLDGSAGSGAISGLKAVAVAVVAHAVWGMAKTLTPDLRRILIGIAAAAAALLLAGVLGQLLAIAIGVGGGLLLCRAAASGIDDEPALPIRVSRRAGIVCLGVLCALLLMLPALNALLSSPGVATADAFSRAGALVFGGGHVVLPLLQAEPAVAHAVSPGQFLAGYGAAQAVPGPLFTFAAYLGAAMVPGPAGIANAALALVAVFLPGILLVLGALPFWNALRRRTLARAAVRGVNAAVVGILAAALYRPVITSGVTDVGQLLIACGCLALLFLRAPAWVAVLLGAGAGILIGVFA
ncbi:MAG: chromate efflux transporter [Actinobacteria bacterium]|nr:chromate efflux transporter [Actinomycetota bacterium]